MAKEREGGVEDLHHGGLGPIRARERERGWGSGGEMGGDEIWTDLRGEGEKNMKWKKKKRKKEKNG